MRVETTPVPQVVLVAGGAGSRLRPAMPAAVPKLLAPVQGDPFLHYVLALLIRQQVRRLHLCLGQGARAVLDYLTTAADPGIEITTTVETEPLGTAGCLRAAGDALDGEFVLMLGDTYTPVDLQDLTRRHRAAGTEASMAVLHNRDWLVTSNVTVQGALVSDYRKNAAPGTREYVDYGIAILRRSSLERLPGSDPVDLDDLFRSLVSDHELAALPVGHRFYEIGSPGSYGDFVQLVREGNLPSAPVPWNRPELGADAGGSAGPVKQMLSTQTRFVSPWMTLREDSVIHPDGSVAPFAVVTRADAVMILGESASGRILMTYQYRYAVGRWSLELPQGERRPSESPIEAGLRELREETGWVGVDAKIVAQRLHEAGDWATQRFAVLSVRLHRLDRARPDLEERGLASRWIDWDDIPKLARTGDIWDAATLAALFLSSSGCARRCDQGGGT